MGFSTKYYIKKHILTIYTMTKETPSKVAASALSDLELKDSQSNLKKQLEVLRRRTGSRLKL